MSLGGKVFADGEIRLFSGAGTTLVAECGDYTLFVGELWHELLCPHLDIRDGEIR
jgi:hypothetical protein